METTQVIESEFSAILERANKEINACSSGNQEEKIFACILKSTIERFLATDNPRKLAEKLAIILNRNCNITYNKIHNRNQVVLYERKDIAGSFLDLKDSYLFYLTMKDILGKLNVVSMPHFFADLLWMQSFIKFFKELNINPFKDISIVEIGGRNEDCTMQNPIFLFINTFFRSYLNISANQEAKTSPEHDNFVKLSNYKTIFGDKQYDYVWTSNVISLFVINSEKAAAEKCVDELFKVCSYIVKPHGKIFHLTGYDDPMPEMRPGCLNSQYLNNECKLVRLPAPDANDDRALRVNLFSSIK